MKATTVYFILSFLCSIAQMQWLNNYDKAIEQSQTENKPILLVFSGSDWCKPCMRLDQQVFQTNEFKAFANDKLILLKADFPRKRKNRLSKTQKKHNEALAEKYNKKGAFPFVVLLNKEGKVLKTINLDVETPKEMIEQLE